MQFFPEKSLADNPEDLTDVQFKIIDSSGMNQMEAEALEEEIYDFDDCIEGDEDACDELSEIIEELEDDPKKTRKMMILKTIVQKMTQRMIQKTI